MFADFLKALLLWLQKPALPPPNIPPTRRSPEWSKMRDAHLKLHPTCVICGSIKKVVPHHILPVHVWPSLELEPGNLISLCEGTAGNHHITFGHLGNWESWNENVVIDAGYWRQKFVNRPQAPEQAA